MEQLQTLKAVGMRKSCFYRNPSVNGVDRRNIPYISMKYPEYSEQDLVKVNRDILSFWDEHQVFERSIKEREGQEPFVFYEGPPSANGKPGIHHVLARAIKDIFCRYKTIKGYQVKRKGGWDTHGLPVELQVEKEDIGKSISVEDYNEKCKEAVMKYKSLWDDLTHQMGYWVDLDNPYVTFEPEYVESLWSLLKRFHDKGLLYKGYTIQPFSPAAGTGLSSHELNQPGTYQDVKDTSITAQFKLIQNSHSQRVFEQLEEGEEVFAVAWTTTPWTLPSNCALAVGERIEYSLVRTFNPYTHKPMVAIMATDVIGRYFSGKAKDASMEAYQPGDKVIPYEIVGKLKGAELEGMKYEQLMPYVQPDGKAFVMILGDFVTTEEGSGIVHTASVFGADDYRVCQANGIASVLVTDENGDPSPLVNRKGQFVKEVTDFPLYYVKSEYESEEAQAKPEYKSTDVLIAIKLKEENKAFKVEKYEHSYPHCWRTDKPILYYPLESWFIKTTAYKKQLIGLNKTINWKPASTGTGRFGNWLENLVDWNLSRSRYWGTPLPIWRTEDGKEELCIGSFEELDKHVREAVKAGVMLEESPVVKDGALRPDFDPHRPFVDKIVLLSESGKLMHREPDLIDVWFDSGAMPFAQWHYPFENKGTFKESFPADFIAEGVDQTRGWFFTLHAIATMLEGNIAYKNVISNGLVLDKFGRKMSKRLGNAVDPFEMIEQYGADVTRWYMVENASPWDNLKFDPEGLAETSRKFFGTLYNTYNFFALYANLDGFTHTEDEVPLEKRSELDRWIISKLNSLIKFVDDAYEDYEPTKAARAIQAFTTGDLSNWYVRLNRKRFWKSEYNEDKLAAYQTLHTCLLTVAKLSSPVSPFYMDRLYQDLHSLEDDDQDALSVHLSLFPVPNEEAIDGELEDRMALAQQASSLIHSLRKKEKVKVRQPLSRIMIPAINEKQTEHIRAVEEIIKNEVNIKAIEYIDDASGVLVKKAKPNFRRLGQKYGKLMKHLTAAIKGFEQEDLSKLERDNHYELDIEGEKVALTLEDVEIVSEDIPGWSVAKEGQLTVALDVHLDDDLRAEGLARDLVNRVQNLRKDMGLAVQDKVALVVNSQDELLQKAVVAHASYIQEEIQALSLETAHALENGQEIDLGGVQALLTLEKAN